MKRKKVIVALLIVSLLGVVKMAGDNPDWTLPVSIRSQEISNLTVDIGAQSLGHLDIWFTGQTQDMNVNITNTTLDVNVTNSQINANITNTSFDVNVTNSTLNVNVQGTAQVDIQNAEVNVKNLREQVAAPSDLKGFKNTRNVGSGGSVSVTVYTNNEGKTVFLEYLTTAVQGPANATVANTLSPLAVTWRVEIKDSRGTTLYEFFANGNLFMNFDPAIPVPAGGKIVVTMVNMSSEGMYMYVSGVVRTLTG